MKKILFIASESINLNSGGGLANRAFFNSLSLHFPEHVDIIQLHHDDNDIDRPHYFFVQSVVEYLSWAFPSSLSMDARLFGRPWTRILTLCDEPEFLRRLIPHAIKIWHQGSRHPSQLRGEISIRQQTASHAIWSDTIFYQKE